MKKRIFTAIDISDKAREKVFVYIESLRRRFPDLRVGWEKAEKLHLTLNFLGDVDEISLINAENAVKKTARQISDFKLKIHSTGVFPNVTNAKILWLGLDGEMNLLKTTNEILDNECTKFGLAKEKRKFRPHLTIACLREPNKSRQLAETHIQNVFPPVVFEVKSIVIYESTLLSNGSIYSKLQDFSF